MQKRTLNLESHLRQTKAREQLFAFAGLMFYPDVNDPQCVCNGILKVSRVEIKDGSGKLCCQFILDIEDNQELRTTVAHLFQDLSQRALDMHLGQDFEYLSPVETLEVEDSVWFGLTLTFSFKNMGHCSPEFVRERIVPALEQRLPIRFQNLQFWEENGEGEEQDLAALALREFTLR